MVVAAVAGIAVFAGTERALDASLALRASWPRDVDTLVLPRSSVLGALSLGHRELAADLVAARANIYFGTQLASHDEQRRLAEALNTAVDLDPRFHRLYLRGAAMLVYTGGNFTVDSFMQANHLLERGERSFPSDWELPFQRGFNLLFELPKLVSDTDPRVPDWRQRGAEALREAALLDGAPPASQPGRPHVDQGRRRRAGHPPPGTHLRGHQQRRNPRRDCPPAAGPARPARRR